MEMTTPNNEQAIMSRIMKLLERAEHPGTPEAEAQACRDKAEAMMAQHQIDRMDLTPEERSKIVCDVWDLNVGGSKGGYNYEYASQVTSLLLSVLEHCGIRVNRKYEYARTDKGTDFTTRRIKVVGFPEDISYAERIWFRVYKEFISNLAPKWDPKVSLGENAYNFVTAGLEWQDMVKLARTAGDDRIPEPEVDQWGKFIPGNRPLVKGIALIRDAYKAECAERGVAYAYRKGSQLRVASRNSFAQSFNSTIRHRLDEMREKAAETVSDKDKFALALVDTKEQVDAEFYRLFPEYDPAVRQRMRETEEFEAACRWAALSPEEQQKVLKEQAAEEARWARRASRARANYGRVRTSNRDKLDHAAWERGRATAQKVNLRDDGEVKDQRRKGIK